MNAMSLFVLTFNIWAIPNLGPKILSPLREARVEMICEHFREASAKPNGWDVLLLQEVWLEEDREKLSHCGYPHVAMSEDRDKIMDSGLMILSKYPIRRVQRLIFRKNGNESLVHEDGEALVRKSALFAGIQYLNQHIGVVNSHLVSVYGVPDKYFNQRRDQLLDLLSWSKDVAGTNPLIIGGDLNFGPRSALWNDLMGSETFVQSPMAEQGCTLCPPNFMHEVNEGKFDHLLGSDHWRAVSGGPSMDKAIMVSELEDLPPGVEDFSIHLSDHFGWETTFELKSR